MPERRAVPLNPRAVDVVVITVQADEWRKVDPCASSRCDLRLHTQITVMQRRTENDSVPLSKRLVHWYTLNSLLTPCQRSYGTNNVVHSTNKIDRIMNKFVRSTNKISP